MSVSSPLTQYDLMYEKDLDRHVRKLCDDLGLLRYHPMDSRGSASGYPDLTVVGPHGVLWAELKSATGQLRPAQVEWRDRLLAAGCRWHLWRPADLGDGSIARELASVSIYRERPYDLTRSVR